MSNSLRVDRDVPMQVRDGTILRADIYRPDDNARHPAILFRTPYDKSLSAQSDYLNIIQAAHAGYAIVVQDVRGRFASEGEWRRDSMFTIEGPDGYDTVEWIASEPWCDGNVGSAGGSYLAGLQWATAMETPPHLKAMAPWFGIWGAGMEPRPTGGAILLTVALAATPMMAMDVANRLERAGNDVTDLRRAINWVMDNPEDAANFLPLKDFPPARFDRIRETWNMRLYPPPAHEQQKRQRFENVTTPCFYACGWYDIIEWATFESYKTMRERGGSPRATRATHYGVGVVPGPLEQSRVEQRSDVLCYTTLELDDDVEVTGPLQVHLFAATSARDTDFTAKLVDVYPDGRAYNIVEGIIRASGRKLNGTRELVTPDETNEYVIQMGDTSQLFRKGHRIRIEISSSNFPMFDRNMNTGNPIGEDTRGIPATQTIYHQSDYASYIDLPVIPS